MGLSASQGRMLLLTARKSDLEFRAQQISQKRLVLASQLEEIATDYESATSNRQMMISLYNGNPQEDENAINKTSNLTYAALVSGTVGLGKPELTGIQSSMYTENQEFKSNVPYRLVNVTGEIVVADINEIPGISTMDDKGELNSTGQDIAALKNGNSIDAGNGIKITKGKDGVIRVTQTSKDSNGEAFTRDYVIDPALRFGSTDANGMIDGPNYLQDCLRNGKYLIQKGSNPTDSNGTVKVDELNWRSISWDATSNVSDKYYLEDDDRAKAEYDRKTNSNSKPR